MGYLFDCIDGNMARKFNMGSKYGMALDMVSDNITSVSLLLYIIYQRGMNIHIIGLIVVTYLLGICTGINDAISSHNATQSDNFYAKKLNEFKDESYFLADYYLLIIKSMYSNYKFLFPEYNKEKLKTWLKILKEFGPGNFTIFFTYVIYHNFKN
jgi:phosphatidylglycerophosphate synthase